MKKLYTSLALGLCIILFQSCSKDVAKPNQPAPAANTINVAVAANQVYQLTLTGSNAASIVKQASHYQTSQTTANAETGLISYKYIPELNFSGKDQVILSKTVAVTSSDSHSGCSHGSNSGSPTTSYATTYTTINITVTN